MKKFFSKFKTRAGAWSKTADKLTMCLAAVVIAASLFTVVPAFADDPPQPDSNLGGFDVSLSRFSEIIAGAFNDVMSQSYLKDGCTAMYMEKVDAGDIMTMGNIGNFLGYPGGNDTSADSSNVWTKGTDAASKVMTLQSVYGFYSDGRDVHASNDSLMSKYIVFGSALNYLGVDEFRDAQGAADGLRMITGYAAYVCFILAYSASSIMETVVKLMRRFNIFAMFWDGFTGFLTQIVGTDNKFLQVVQGAYNIMMGMRWIFLGFSILAIVAVATVWKSKAYGHAANVQQKSRNLLYKIIIMAIGIPLLGMAYTTSLDVLIGKESDDYNGGFGTNAEMGYNDSLGAYDSGFLQDAQYVITDYIFQEFLDFERWTVGAAGGAPSEYGGASAAAGTSFKVDAKVDGEQIDGFHVVYDAATQNFDIRLKDGAETSLDASQFVLAINYTTYGKDTVGDIDDIQLVRDLYGDPGSPDATAKSFSDMLHKNESGIANKEAYLACRNLILNYARSNTVIPDVLNDIYLKDMSYLAKECLATSGSNVAAVNATAREQLFGVNAADQRIWSYAGVFDDMSKWIYENDTNKMDVVLVETADQKITATLEGLSAGGKSGNCVKVNNKTIMGCTLTNSSRFSWGAPGSTQSIDTTEAKIEQKDGNYSYTYQFDLTKGGMAPLSLYNYMHTKFENGSITVYSPDNTTNAGVGMMHYSVTTPYSGIPEIVQLLYIICILFSIGIIGWVFGISLLMNTIVQTIKAIPILFKVMMGSLQGFVEGLLTVCAIIVEILVTVFLYTQAINIIDFLIKLVKYAAQAIIRMFNKGDAAADPESYAIMSGILSMLIILWGTFQLIKWRKAITISIKSLLTHVLNTVFGTSAAMPTGASSGMLKAGAALATGAMVAGALNEQGALGDVVDDLTQSDLGSSLSEKISEGDWDGAMEDVKDFAGGTYRGKSDTADAEAALGEDGIGTANKWQGLTEDQEQQLEDEYGDEARDAAADLEQAKKDGDPKDIEKAQDKFDDVMQRRAAAAAGMRQKNFDKANELGVADYSDYLKQQDEEEEARGLTPVDGADIPEEPSKELDADAKMAYDAARDGDEATLRTASKMYDANGLTADQSEAVTRMVLEGADETEVAAAIDNFAQDNFGDNYQDVIDKINEAANRTGGETYGSSDATEGSPRTVDVKLERGEKGAQYAVTDNNSDAGAQTITVTETGDSGSGGQVTYRNETAGSADRGQSVVTGDFGGRDAAAGETYGEIRNDVSAIANAGGTMIQKGSGSGTFGATTVSEAAVVHAQDLSQQGGGTVTANYGSWMPGADATDRSRLQAGIDMVQREVMSSPAAPPPAQTGGPASEGTIYREVMGSMPAGQPGVSPAGPAQVVSYEQVTVDGGTQYQATSSERAQPGAVNTVTKLHMVARAGQDFLASGPEVDPNAQQPSSGLPNDGGDDSYNM